MTPVVAVVGRPNVGKSTLVNRILSRRQAVVQDTPGVTRDRVMYDAEWAGSHFTLVDTGGWEPDADGRAAQIAVQAEYAMRTADLVVFVLDVNVGVTDADMAAVRVLRAGGKPVLVVANKVDGERSEADAAQLWSLGLGEPHSISALHGRGTGDFLEVLVKRLSSTVKHQHSDGLRRVALLGRPNVGKSSLLNALSREERVVVDSVAGTTVDPVDSVITLDGQEWRFVDTAGLRRRVHMSHGAEYYASLRTSAALESAEVAVVLLDAAQPISDQDRRIINMAVDAGRALVLVFNKWDCVDQERREDLEREITTELAHVEWASRINISALTGRSVQKLTQHLRSSLSSWDMRVPTSKLNAWMKSVTAQHPHPVRGGKQPRILFITQADVRPPRFLIFATGFLEASYRRFLVRRLRESFGFGGTPVEVSVKLRSSRSARDEMPTGV